MIYESGDVVLVPFPFTDQTTTKQRPAVVISTDAYNRGRQDIIVIGVTSQVRRGAALGEVTITRWKEAGLLRPSVIKPVLATLHRRLIIRRLGKLRAQDRVALQAALAQIVRV